MICRLCHRVDDQHESWCRYEYPIDLRPVYKSDIIDTDDVPKKQEDESGTGGPC